MLCMSKGLIVEIVDMDLIIKGVTITGNTSEWSVRQIMCQFLMLCMSKGLIVEIGWIPVPGQYKEKISKSRITTDAIRVVIWIQGWIPVQGQ